MAGKPRVHKAVVALSTVIALAVAVALVWVSGLVPGFARGKTGAGQDGDAVENSLASSQFRQKYHFYNPAGFMNDVQTIWKGRDGRYHFMYLQNSQFKHDGDGTEWAHVTTDDFVHYRHEGIAIAKHVGGWDDMATGSIVRNEGKFFADLDEHALVAYFTSYMPAGQQQFVAYSTDEGKTFKPYAKEPVLKAPDASANFRDPYVTIDPEAHRLTMYLAAGDRVSTYTSDDGLSFDHAGDTMIDADTLEDGTDLGLIECPNVKTLTDPDTGERKTVLFFGANGYNHSQPTGTYYMVGHLDQDAVFVPEQQPKRMDDGSDYYGANFMQQDDRTVTSLAWMGNWDYTNKSLEDDHGTAYNLGSLSLAHQLRLAGHAGDYSLSGSFIEPKALYGKAETGKARLGQAQGQGDSQGNGQGKDGKSFTKECSSYQRMRFELTPESGGTGVNGHTSVTLKQQDSSVTIDYDADTGQYTVARTTTRFTDAQGANHYSKKYASVPSGVPAGGKAVLNILEDQSSVELWFEGGGRTYTLAKFSTDTRTQVTVSATRPTSLRYSFQDVGSI